MLVHRPFAPNARRDVDWDLNAWEHRNPLLISVNFALLGWYAGPTRFYLNKQRIRLYGNDFTPSKDRALP